jgi:iron(III) transport system ATP-binding protein
MPDLRLMNLGKQFGRTMAVENLDLAIHDGEIMTLLGPSGCGKTTTLRCIAGLLKPDEGEIYLGEKRITDLPPEKRGVGLVFQNYALWPHMTVFQNLGFGLQLKGVSREKARKRIDDALAMVRLSGFEERYPRQLSGGQQQRVALARALVIEPSLLLLDEPLSNLDAQLREEMRFEIRELQKKLGVTSVYVTHDQAEALVLSDRIAILHQGQLVQVGTPEEIYNRPGNKFVAGFIGLTSFIEGTVTRFEDGGVYAIVETQDELSIRARAAGLALNQKVTLAIRPEHMEVCDENALPPSPPVNLFQGKVLRGAYLGDIIDYRIQVGNWTLRAHTPTDKSLTPGQVVWLAFAPDRVTWIAA